VAKIQGDETTIVTIASAAAKLGGDIRIVEPGDTVMVKGIEVKCVPAYNVNKFRSPGVPYHPQDSGHVGFIIAVDDQRVYHAGDTDHIPEMAEFGEIDIAMLPISGGPVMTVEEAVEAVTTIDPRIAIPIHIGRWIGSEADAQRFKEQAPVEVAMLEMEG
jgi:L-ascorbate metabolism protein UlaG (beta-lactamase superfamily)